MSRHVLLIRGVNVGGRKLPMADLRRGLEEAGLGEPVTYLQSGNAVVTSAERPPAVGVVAEQVIAELGLQGVRVLVRSAEELGAVAAACPFEPEGAGPYLTFLEKQPAKASVAAVPPEAGAPDRWQLGDRVVYLDCPGGYGRSKLGNQFWERELGVAATTRNWKTLGALIDLARA